MSDSLSLSVVEEDFEQAKWKMASRFTKEAERLYSENDHVGAYKLCEKVLDAAPQYFPAQKLLEKCIESAVPSGADEEELQPDHDTSPNSPPQFDSDWDDTLNLEAQLNRRSKKTVKFLDEDDTLLVELTNESSEPSGPKKGHSSAANANKLDRRGRRREMYVRELLLDGHFHQKQAIEVFLGLKELLWSEDTSTYVCPVPTCSLQFKTRVLCVNHYLVAHMKTDASGVQVQPFACKTCKELTRFKTLQELVKHGRTLHPRCRWLDPLVTAMQKDS